MWAGKKEPTSFEVPTVSLHVHERIDPRTIIEAVRKRNGVPLKPAQGYLFETREENPPLREAVDFYRHAHGLVLVCHSGAIVQMVRAFPTASSTHFHKCAFLGRNADWRQTRLFPTGNNPPVRRKNPHLVMCAL